LRSLSTFTGEPGPRGSRKIAFARGSSAGVAPSKMIASNFAPLGPIFVANSSD
jgi:hypothetical protein